MWHLIFTFATAMNILGFLYPFLVSFDVKFNILHLHGVVTIKIFNKIKLDFTIRIKNGYVYINRKNKQRKEKIAKNNFILMLVYYFIGELYFREQFLNLSVMGYFGYNQNAQVTALGCAYGELFLKTFFSKIKNNKKSSHIFVGFEPNYNQDILNVQLSNTVRISVFDLLYAFVYTLIKSWGNYEKVRKRAKQ